MMWDLQAVGRVGNEPGVHCSRMFKITIDDRYTVTLSNLMCFFPC